MSQPAGVKRIFLAGVPGSRWSSVARAIYFSPECDRSDDLRERSYTRPGAAGPMHLGAYWGPGMGFGEQFDRLDQLSPEVAEAEFDAPFSGTGLWVIKSHSFCCHIGYLRRHWPESPIVLVHRADEDCLSWWLEAGGFSISYPDYRPYYLDESLMAERIREQNRALLLSAESLGCRFDIADSHVLARRLGIEPPAEPVAFQAADTWVGLIQ